MSNCQTQANDWPQTKPRSVARQQLLETSFAATPDIGATRRIQGEMLLRLDRA
jgi:hypothetical protein